MVYVLLILLCSSTAYSQLVSPLSTPPPTASMAPWCKYMYAEPLNMLALDSAYRAYYAHHPFEKNNYTRYYKRLTSLAQQYLTRDGFVYPKTLESIQNSLSKEQEVLHQSSQVAWKAIGPHETYFSPESNRGLGDLCPWQANIYAFDISLSNPGILYALGETGGLFKTTNKGLQWTQLESGVNSNGEAVCVHPMNPSICYIGVDGGILRTTDGGKTWAFIWKMQGAWVYEIKVHTTNNQVILAGTNKGLYRSDNAGTTWKQILPHTVCDIKMAYGNNSICYALQFDPATKRYEFWKSTDAGATFAVQRNGWLNTITSSGGGRMTITPADPKRIYVVLLSDSSKPYLLRSNNYGDTWAITATGTTSAFPMNNGQGYYDLAIAASHTNADGVIVGTQTTYRSMDGGKTFTALGGYAGPFPIHPDLQDVKCSGTETWIATDGGFTYSTDFFSETKNAQARIVGLNGADFWGFDSGWNEDVLVGGRYHNGNTAWHENYGTKYYRMGGGEAPTGYVNPILNRHTFFSDIGSYSISPDIDGNIISHPVGKFPNESYYAMEYSSMVWDPRCYSIVWLGKDNVLWRSTNNGQSYDSIFASPDKAAMLEHIVIARSNPNVMYVSQRSNSLGDGKIWKTTDGGKSWQETAVTPGTTGWERRVSKITLSATNDKELWVAYRAGGNNNKVFHSVDGGESWTNLTTSLIENEVISDIVHQQGTNGGVYIACDRGRMFYRNNDMKEWVHYGTGLPIAHFTRSLKPFYRDNKLRAGSSMGIWELPLYEHSKPIAQPSVDKFTTRCQRDTFFFDDYSVLERANAQWEWSFPGAVYVSNNKIRNPKVLYGKQGVYPVTLTVKNDYGSDTYSNMAFIEIFPLECNIDTLADKALSLSKTNDVATLPAIPALKNAKGFTTTMWLKLDSIQYSFSQLLSNWSSDVGFSLGFSFQGYRKNTNMTFYWKNVPYQLTSPFNLPIGDWVHVALSVDTNKVTLYMNGEPWEYKNNNANFRNFDLSSTPWEIGGGLPGQGGNYRGDIEELRIYNRTLSTEEIRKNLHLTEQSDNSSLVAYYQFNESTPMRFYNKMGAIHAVNSGGILVPSTAPVAHGIGEIAKKTLNGWEFPKVGLLIPDKENGQEKREMAAYRLFAKPDTMPAIDGNREFTISYWIIRTWSNAKPVAADSLIFSAIGYISASDASSPQNCIVSKRAFANEHRKTWFSVIPIKIDASRQSVTIAADSNIVGQYIVAAPYSLPSNVEEYNSPTMMQLLPNPTDNTLTVIMNNDTPVTIRIVNTMGQTVMTEKSTAKVIMLNVAALATGSYTVYAEHGNSMSKEQLILIR